MKLGSKRGKSYLVFAKTINGLLRTSLCSGNRPLDQAAAAVNYHREARRTGSRPNYLFGYVTNRFADVRLGLGLSPTWPVRGVRVRVSGEGRSTESVSQPDGSFGFFNLAPGDYRVEAGEQGGFEAFPGLPLRVPESGCAEVHLLRRSRVSVRVRGPDLEGFFLLEPEGVDMNRPASARPGNQDPELGGHLSGGVTTLSVPPWRYRLALKELDQSGKRYHSEIIDVREGTPVAVEFRPSRSR